MSRLIALVGLCTIAACGFDGGVPIFGGGSNPDAGGGTADGDPGGDGPTTPDAPPGDQPNVAHLPPSEWGAGTIDVVIPPGTTVEVDTEDLDLGSLPDGLDIELVEQVMPGPEVAVVRVGSLTISEAATLRVWGSHPLIIISDGPVEIKGLLTVAADRGKPGPGGYPGGGGPGVGGNGEHKGARDGGGGGGGFGSSGADGGDATTTNGSDADGGEGGDPYLSDILEVLVGGSGGGEDGLDCSYLPGAGGGAIQIYSYSSINVSLIGAINAGGGGGGAGRLCASGGGTSRGGGTGGGAGGAIYLQAPTIEMAGRLAANGGGGGGGADITEGSSGFNGQITSKASGGFSGGGASSPGGSGGFQDDPPQPGFPEISGEGNAGGGGGGFGRIVLSTRESLSFDSDRSSPEATTLSY